MADHSTQDGKDEKTSSDKTLETRKPDETIPSMTRQSEEVKTTTPDGKTSFSRQVIEVDGGGADQSAHEVTTEAGGANSAPARNRVIGIVTIVAVFAIVFILALYMLFFRGRSQTAPATETKVSTEAKEADEHGEGEGKEVKLSAEALEAAGIEIEGVTQRPAVARLRATGTVENNQQQTQQATPLVGGRVEQVRAQLGDRVRAGSVLAVIASPEIAELHGKLHEAETQLALAERNYIRVQRAENRVAVLSAKAKLDEAESNLRRVRRLVELGAGAGKDVVAAEAAYKTAKAEYDFQSNISLNRELQEARAAVETARVDVGHIRDQLRALGAPVPAGERDDHSKNTSLIAVRAPVTGTVTERLVNVGAGVEAGKPLFTIANISTVWVIANVPEAQVGLLRPGTPAEIRSAALGEGAIAGRVSYIDPQLNEETRTARVRLEVVNQNERLKAGMFVEVGFEAGTGPATGEELVVPTAAVQKIGDRTVVFIPKEDEQGAFEVRDVELGGEVEGYSRVLSGLKLGERVVTKGSFMLKSQMLKGEMGEDEH
ncbi:MAG TPA: efflux RND transporter periplasmic adaptor subunit [Pyrinomonadaceae bacterium]|nr:efflux RND transporter periplasmic adaptor subunit [Pyrinomonadaceae bacterium]